MSPSNAHLFLRVLRHMMTGQPTTIADAQKIAGCTRGTAGIYMHTIEDEWPMVRRIQSKPAVWRYTGPDASGSHPSDAALAEIRDVVARFDTQTEEDSCPSAS